MIFFRRLSFIDQLIFLNICYCFYAFRNCQKNCTLHTGMDGKLFNQTHFPAKRNVIRSTRFSLSFSLLLCWWYSCTCSYTYKVQAENLIRRFTNTSPKIRESRGDWLWKMSNITDKKTTTVLQFMLGGPRQRTTLCFLFTNWDVLNWCHVFIGGKDQNDRNATEHCTPSNLQKHYTRNKGVWQAS